ncbi:hypothetical protein SRABI84_02676 [Peribacillus simplex]|nr:hypothetical protein SRABI84_02676 [Peribacillus simplex]
MIRRFFFPGLLVSWTMVIFFSFIDVEGAIESEELILIHIMKEHVYNMLLFCRL